MFLLTTHSALNITLHQGFPQTGVHEETAWGSRVQWKANRLYHTNVKLKQIKITAIKIKHLLKIFNIWFIYLHVIWPLTNVIKHANVLLNY